MNQGDATRRLINTALMKDMYGSSERGIVWLGPASRNSDTWYDYVRERCHDGNRVLCGIIVQHSVASCMNKTCSLDLPEKKFERSSERRGLRSTDARVAGIPS